MIMKNQEVQQVLKGSLKKRKARNFNKTNTAILLLEMANMSSLHEVKASEARYGRRYSCPNIQQNGTRELVPRPSLATSNSCTHCAETLDTDDLLKLEDLKHDVRRASESTKEDMQRDKTCQEYLEKERKRNKTETHGDPINNQH